MAILDIFETDKSPIKFIIWGLVLVAVSGLFFAIMYFFLDQTQTAVNSVDCVLTDNVFGDTCQDLFTMILTPFFALKTVFIYLSIFFIFVLVVGMVLSGYNSGTKPSMLGLVVLIEIGLTYSSLWVANIYRTLLDNEIIRDSLINFSVYNKIMMNFPWFVFIVSLFSIALGIVNWQRTRTNTPTGELDY